MRRPQDKLKKAEDLAAVVGEAKRVGRRAVFTNGCFDLLHLGHITYLAQARTFGDYLIVAVNSDASVRRLKGPCRPLVPEKERALLLAALECVDYVTIFDEDVPLELLKRLRPEVYVKGGDYRLEQIPERHAVGSYGGQVVLLTHVEGKSTTGLIEAIVNRYGSQDSAILGPETAEGVRVDDSSALTARVVAALQEALSAQRQVHEHLVSMPLLGSIIAAAQRIATALASGRKVLALGNGGSAADAQHLAAELVGRFALERRAFPAMALTADVPVISAIANDYDYTEIFARQLEALACPGDVVVAISTSGSSGNVVRALEVAKRLGAYTIGLLGREGGLAREKCDLPVVVPSGSTPRIQEAHALIIHVVCQAVEQYLFADS